MATPGLKSEITTLRDSLIEEGRTRWLDLGCGGNFEEGFLYVDTFAEGILCANLRNKYFRLDIANWSRDDLEKLGKFDLVRLQHTLEHFTYEDGQRVIELCSYLLRQGGQLLITVPDLEVHVRKYLDKGYDSWAGYKSWASKRVPPEAPPSFYFSVFAFSMSYEPHKWCYDLEGLMFLLNSSDKFCALDHVALSDPRASVPFTHNRPEEDLCVIATLR